MGDYRSAEATFADAAAKIELGRQLYPRVQPSIKGTPAELYVRKRLPEAAANVALACENLGYLAPPIEGRPVVDHALVSLLHNLAGEVSGLQLEFCDILGARTATAPSKQTYALREYGVRDGLFHAGGNGDIAHLTEGYSCDALAVASLGMGPTYGGGGRGILGCAVPPESTVVIVPDRRPPDGPDALEHDKAYKRAEDLLLLAGKTVFLAKPPDCTHPGGVAGCKDATDVLRQHGRIRLKELIGATELSALSPDGEARKLAQIDDPLERDQATKAKAVELKVGVALLRDRVAHYREQLSRPRKGADRPPPLDLAALAGSAAEIIASTDVLGRLATAVGAVLAGETANVKILYLVGTSRLFSRVMSAALKGPSAAGKSEIRKRVLDFFPEEDVVSFTTLSEKALLYFEGDFSHKILSMGEAAGAEEQTLQDYLLRELISEGRLRYPVVQKIGSELITTTIEKNGPVAFLVTTTQHSLDPEVETRLLSLEIDDTTAQTRMVMLKVAAVEGTNTAAQEAADLECWHDYQRWLAAGPRSVIVPYADALATLISDKAVRLRRDFGQLIRAIKSHALLHREHRARARGEIVADIEHDYTTVRELLIGVISHGAGLMTRPSMQETIDSVAKLTGTAAVQVGVTALEVGKELNLDKSSARRRLLAAAADGHLTNLETKRGRPGRYIVSTTALEAAALLPTAQELLEYLHGTAEKPLPPCHHSQKADQDQEVTGGKTGGKTGGGGNGADPVAYPVPPGVPPVTSCDTSGNDARWHGGSDSGEGGNGLDADTVVDGVLDGSRCGFCGCTLDGEASEQIGDKRYHSEACVAEARKRAAAAVEPPPQPKRRSRLKRPPADAGQA